MLESRMREMIKHAEDVKDIIEKIDNGKLLEVEPLERIMVDEKMMKIEKAYYPQKAERKRFVKEAHRLIDKWIPELHVFQQWNSFTPILSDTHIPSHGGGYFLYTGVYGIAIDPGFNFIQNLQESGKFFFNHIDAILITHAHNDHMADLESLLSLLHDYNEEEIKGEALTEEKKRTIYNKTYWDQPYLSKDEFKKEVENRFKYSPRRKRIEIFLTASAFRRCNYLKLERDYECHIEVVDTYGSGIKAYKLNNSVLIHPIRAKHNDLVSDYHCAGFLFLFQPPGEHTGAEDTALLYTGDTGFDEEIRTVYDSIRTNLEGKKIFLLAHIGGFKRHEEEYFTDEDDTSKAYYKYHLGRIGLSRLVETVKPDVVLLSEFGEEFRNGCRSQLVDLYQLHYKAIGTVFLPMDNGFCMRLRDGKVEAICSDPSKVEDKTKALAFIPYKDVGYRELSHEQGYQLCYIRKGSNLDQILQASAVVLRDYRIKALRDG